MKGSLKTALMLSVAVPTLCVVPFGSAACAQGATRTYAISPQPLDRALRQFADQSGRDVVFDPAVAAGKTSKAVQGTMSDEAALRQLTAGSGLSFKTTSSGFAVTSGNALAGGPNAGSESASSTDGGVDPEFADIIVTAQKRRERLLDVPVPVTSLNASRLSATNQLRLQDYYSKVPGLGLALIGDGSAPAVVVRGITTGGNTNPVVGIVIDDIPYGATITGGLSPTAPDIDPGDLESVEVLRGPQGALYGAASIGGLLKFITIAPSLDDFFGRVQAGVAAVHDGGDVGYTLRGSLNAPLGPTMAVRASAYSIREPGFIDAVNSGEHDINRRDTKGGSLAVLWQPTDDFSVKLRGYLQDSERMGTDNVDRAVAGDLNQIAVPDSGRYQRKSSGLSATLQGTFSNVKLTSLTGYSRDRIFTNFDATSVPFGVNVTGATLAQQNFGVGGLTLPLYRRADKFSQEIRADVTLSSRINWLIGAFYTNEKISYDAHYIAADFVTGREVGSIGLFRTPTTFEEKAIFSNITFDISSTFDIQVGGRISKNRQTFSAQRTGVLAPIFFGTTLVIPELRASDSSFTYLVTPRLRLSNDVMVYARIATGYRPGGPNTNCGRPDVPCEYRNDSSKNYEIGLKGTAFNRVVSFDASVFRIDWSDLQLMVSIPPVASYQLNASAARSQGAELALDIRPFAGTTVGGWVAYTDAELSENVPTGATVRGLKGDRLPYSSRYSASAYFDQRFQITDEVSGSVGATVAYVGDRRGVFRAAVLRETFPSYAQIDLRGGIKWNAWSIDAYINNLTDKRGVLRSGFDSTRPTYVTYIRPRNYGITLSKTF